MRSIRTGRHDRSHSIDHGPLARTPRTTGEVPGFGRPILAPIGGFVLAAHDAATDHEAYRGLPSVRYALTRRRRAATGWTALAGNHVLIENGGLVIALCHLRQNSALVRPGQRVHRGDALGRCGNSGNSTEPHVHVQAIDNRDIEHAVAVPLTFDGSLPRSGELIDADEERRSS